MRGWVVVAWLVTAGCAGPPSPATISMGQDACAQCRMVIVSKSTAAQIVSPGEEPRFFDELGCLRDYLATNSSLVAEDALVFVADHRTGEWVDARHALFTRTGIATPMGSGLVAHADAASRDADPQAHGGSAIVARDILGVVSERTAR